MLQMGSNPSNGRSAKELGVIVRLLVTKTVTIDDIPHNRDRWITTIHALVLQTSLTDLSIGLSQTI